VKQLSRKSTMTLAVLLLWWVSHTTLLAYGQSAPAAQNPPNAPTPAATQSSPTTPAPAKASATKPAKKKKPAVNCDSAPASEPAPTSSTGTGDAAAAQTTAPPTNCPPTKKIVRQGGTSEPSIQLAGTGPESQQADSINHMLASTDDNLKKLAGQTVSSNQQDTVNQIHQFQDQSRMAIKTGDFDRARTLAWKAQTLSQELVNPQQ
jgi:hypothetical protein